MLDNYRVLFAYHSGKIENPAVDYHDAKDNIIYENGMENPQCPKP
jgi:hypothetical protein